MIRLITCIIISQLLFVTLIPVWEELIEYLNILVIAVAWLSITTIGIIFGLLWSKKKINLSVTTVHVGMLFYTAGLIILLFFRPNGPGADNINVIPFETIKLYLSGNAEPLVALYNIGANIVLTIPLGIYYRLVAKKPSLLTLLLIAVLSISIIEVSQLILGRGSMDIDDLILNTTGFIVGYLLTPLIQKKKRFT